ncbi:cell envelope integrity protein TolA [Chromohalobacter sp. 11-W]|uniref:cell envelope integrity protein TolA n=1 Tax=Chromohalobacter sp. 11-W TaxID=2994061 RepID=UPI002468FB44|nr:cell envelope integrity protein TolA [Chromohalobacter sp. 11-W]
MAKRERRVGYGWPVLLAIGVHIAALMLTIIKWPESEPDPTSSSVVQATLVRAETATDQPQQTEDSAPPASQPEEEGAQEPEESAPAESSEEPAPDSDAEVTDSAVEEAKAEAQRLQEEAQRAAEQRAKAEKRRQAEAEAEKKRQAEAEAERKRQAEAEAKKKRQAEAAAEKKRQAEAEAEAERKRQAEAEAERKRQAEAEAEKKRQAEAERKRQQELAERAAQANNSSLDSMISDEEQSIANAKQANEAANGFKNLVRRYVEQSWNVPSNASSELRAIVRIQLLPTGELVSATITQSSGNSAFDHSVISAVEKAAPFREMRELDASVKGRFREFNLDFNPEDIR